MFKIYNKNNLPEHIVRHSPDGFAWGYGGSGPAELARCLLIDVVEEEVAEGLYQEFKWEFVAKWDDNWEISDAKIKQWVDSKLANK